MPWKKHHYLLIILLLALSASVYLRAINPDKFGFYHDDGLYLVTAKALATGQGYKILSLPEEPLQTKYPPFFPLALSMLWRANPDFPGNLFLFSGFSALSILAFLALAASFLSKRSYADPIQVLLILFFTALNWRTVILATSILSEAFFAALSVCVLWLAFSQGEKRALAKGWGLGILMAMASLTRLAGISLLAAVVLYALTRKRIRRFLLPIFLASAIIAGWFLWCQFHQASSIGSHVAYYTNYFQDWHSLLQADESGIQGSFLGSLLVMIGKNAGILLVNIPVACLGIQIDWLQSMLRTWGFPIILIGLFVLILLFIGFIKTRSAGNGLLHYYILAYIALHLLWPYTIYDRFLNPILPFLLLFILSGGIHILRRCFADNQVQKQWAKAASIAFFYAFFASLFIAACLGLSFGLHEQLENSKTYRADALEKRELTAWLKANTHERDILICRQDPVYYLYTGTKALRLPAPENGEPVHSYGNRLREFIGDNRATLLLHTKSDFALESYPANKRTILTAAIRDHPSDYVPVFSTRNRKSTLYRLRIRSAPGF